jgi:ubiquinone biosynthesis protein
MLREAAKDLNRLRRITQTIGKYGYHELIKRSPDLPKEISTDDFAPVDPTLPKTGPRAFRLMLEELGPTFIKFGQVMSTRPDLIPKAYVDELRTLQDECEPLPFEQIKQALREGLPADPDELFRSIEETPLATASIAQVHRGVTRDGKKVVVKVQRPGISEQVRTDIDVLYRIARFLHAILEESAMAEPVGIVREFEKALDQELNFHHEAQNLREFARTHAMRKDVAIPKVHEDLSSMTVLTMDYLEGVPFSRLPDGIDRKEIAARIIREAFDEVFIDGVFHADPHPGNLLLLDDGRYGILDLGLLGKLTPSMQETLVVIALAVAVRDADTIARTLYRLGQADERVSLEAVRDDTRQVLNKYLDKSIKELDSTLLLQELLSLGMKHRLRIPAEYTMLGRAGATIEGIVRELDPDIDVAAVARPYAERLLMGRVGPDNMEGGIYRALLQFQGLSQDMPIQLSQILNDFSSGKFRVDVHGRVVEKMISTILMAAATISGAILGGSFVIGSFIGLAKLDWEIFGIPIVGVLGAVMGSVIFFWTIAYTVLRPRMKKISLMRIFTRRR